jgi:type IV pilus assembly protein PilY1
VIITTLIPGTSDPCSASIQGALLVVDAGTGGSGSGLSNPTGSNLPAGYKVVGTLVNNPPTSGSLPVASAYGGGKILAPGLSGAPSIDAAIWRRRSWRVLSND